LLSTLSALERPERGSIWWGAVNVAAMEPAVAARWRRATVGIVGAAGLPLLGGLSTLQNVLLPARVPALRISRVVQEHARRLLDGVGIDARTPLARLPHADVRRVEIARALVCQSSRPATRHSHHVWTRDTTSRGSRCAG
jgi:putative ABC transport system ATP-binding protein